MSHEGARHRCILTQTGFAVLTVWSLAWTGGAWAFHNNQSARLVIGQADMTSNAANQGGDPAANTLSAPSDAIVAGGKLIVSDLNNHRILIFNAVPTLNNASADLVVGQADMTSGAANRGGAPAANTLYGPRDIFSDGTRLFVADVYNNRVLIFNTIPAVNNAGADLAIGQANLTSNAANQGGAIAANTMNNPRSIFGDGARLFVTDSMNHRALIYNGIPTGNNASAVLVIGQPNMSSGAANQNTTPSAKTLAIPSYIYSDATGVYIADYGNHRILLFNGIPTADNADADLVIGQPNMSSYALNQGGGPQANTLNRSRAVFQSGGKVYVADTENHRLLIHNIVPTANNASADIVLGQANMTSNTLNQGGSSATSTSLNYPFMIHLDGYHLYCADFHNNRVLIYDDPTATPTATRTATLPPTRTPTPTVTVTPTLSPTGTIAATATRTITVLPTETSTARAPEIADEVIAYPAPAKDETVWFYYRTAGPARVQIEIFNPAGERVTRLSEEVKDGGSHRLRWDIGRTAPGIYLYRLTLTTAAGERKTGWHKLAIVK